MSRATDFDVVVIGSGLEARVACAELARQDIRVGLIADLAADQRVGDEVVALAEGAAPRSRASSCGPDRTVVTRVRVWLDEAGGFELNNPGLVLMRSRDWQRQALDPIASGTITVVPGTVSSIRDGRSRVRVHTVDCAAGDRYRIAATHLVIASSGADVATGPIDDQRARPVHTLVRNYAGSLASGEYALILSPPDEFATTNGPRAVAVASSPDGAFTTVRVHDFGGSPSPSALWDWAAGQLRHLDLDIDLRSCIDDGELTVRYINSSSFFAADRRIRIGSAGGLVNPMTGDSLTAAVITSRTAAECIANHRNSRNDAALAYAERVETAELVRQDDTRNRNYLTWRALAATAEDGSPFYAQLRRSLLLPSVEERWSGSDVEVDELIEPLNVVIFLRMCDDLMMHVLRDEWSFIGSASRGYDWGPTRVRPSTLLAHAYSTLRDDGLEQFARLGAALDLSVLGVLGLLAAGGPERRSSGRRVNLHAAAGVLSGDVLLGRAAALVSDYGPDHLHALSGWLTDLLSLRAESREPSELLAMTFEVPARLGAGAAGGGADDVRALARFGWHAGECIAHAEDIAAMGAAAQGDSSVLEGLLEARLSDIRLNHSTFDVGSNVDRRTAATTAREALGKQLAAERRAVDAISGNDLSLDPCDATAMLGALRSRSLAWLDAIKSAASDWDTGGQSSR